MKLILYSVYKNQRELLQIIDELCNFSIDLGLKSCLSHFR